MDTRQTLIELREPGGKAAVCRLTYEECRVLIQSMKFGDTSSLFGNEKGTAQSKQTCPFRLCGTLFGFQVQPFFEQIYDSFWQHYIRTSLIDFSTQFCYSVHRESVAWTTYGGGYG